MCNRFTKLKCKEVINVCDGCRLGYVSDVEVDCGCGQILSIIVPGPCKYFGLGRHEDFVIPWQCIRQIGDDIILVDGNLDKFRLPRSRKELF
ncbi:MAG: YlmC/YmxH family sporulation protein [Oscillospiraceae bacterium]|nr:YlmC/YmxH family sporulation protein [Oscillospiraceae bacterium]